MDGKIARASRESTSPWRMGMTCVALFGAPYITSLNVEEIVRHWTVEPLNDNSFSIVGGFGFSTSRSTLRSRDAIVCNRLPELTCIVPVSAESSSSDAWWRKSEIGRAEERCKTLYSSSRG